MEYTQVELTKAHARACNTTFWYLDLSFQKLNPFLRFEMMHWLRYRFFLLAASITLLFIASAGAETSRSSERTYILELANNTVSLKHVVNTESSMNAPLTS